MSFTLIYRQQHSTSSSSVLYTFALIALQIKYNMQIKCWVGVGIKKDSVVVRTTS